jgi:protein O-GlcNAc transferase
MAYVNTRPKENPSSEDVNALIASFSEGRYMEAATLAEAMTRRFPRHPFGWKVLGAALRRSGRKAEALTPAQKAVALSPQDAEAHGNLGNTLVDLGQLAEAVASYRRAVEIKPDFAQGHSNLGNALKDLGQLAEAVASYRRALEIKPDYAEAHSNLGNILRDLGQLAEAVACCRRAVEIKPDFSQAHNNLGNAMKDLGQQAEAAASYRRALAISPDYAEAHNNLGNVLKDLGQLAEAVASYRRAVEIKPDFAQVHSNLGNAMSDLGQLAEAVASYRRAVEIKPDYAEAHSNLILALHYESGNDAELIAAEVRRWSERHAAPLAPSILPHTNDHAPERRLRIGYVSPDFRAHPVGWFMEPLLAAHDHQAFEIFCYSAVPHADGFTAQLRTHADGWCELAGRTDRQAADLIRADRIDILVDLALHTANNRLSLFALKPAPVQATYLAYPGNSGLGTIDYRITDCHLDPPGGNAVNGAEQPLRLPETYWCYQPILQPAAAINPLPALTAGHVTFGCLNNFCKVTPSVLAAWVRILVATPGASLILNAPLGSPRLRVQALFAGHGIDPQRLRFVTRLPLADYFQLYQSIDLALDPFPFPGGTTTCDALWMGVPVISLAGPTPITRGGLSLLTNIDLPDFIADSVEDYIEKANSVVRDLPRLATLRSGLRDRMQRSPLMDAPRFARNMEAAYRTVWRQWCGRPDANISTASHSA